MSCARTMKLQRLCALEAHSARSLPERAKKFDFSPNEFPPSHQIYAGKNKECLFALTTPADAQSNPELQGSVCLRSAERSL